MEGAEREDGWQQEDDDTGRRESTEHCDTTRNSVLSKTLLSSPCCLSCVPVSCLFPPFACSPLYRYVAPPFPSCCVCLPVIALCGGVCATPVASSAVLRCVPVLCSPCAGVEKRAREQDATAATGHGAEPRRTLDSAERPSAAHTRSRGKRHAGQTWAAKGHSGMETRMTRDSGTEGAAPIQCMVSRSALRCSAVGSSSRTLAQ